MDFGVERLMQMFKTCTGRKLSQGVEKTFANVMLLQQAMQEWRRDGLRSYSELIRDPGLSLMQGRMYDRVVVATDGPKVFLLGQGRPLRAKKDGGNKSEKERAMDATLQVISYLASQLFCTGIAMAS
jgi:hypothetical protein